MANAKKPSQPEKTDKPKSAEASETARKLSVEEAATEESTPANQTQPKSIPTVSPPKPAKPKRGGFLALVSGGIIAGAIGFGASQYLGADGWPFRQGPSEVEKLSQVVEAQTTELEALNLRVKSLDLELKNRVDISVTNDLAAGQSLLKTDVKNVTASLLQLEKQLQDVENRPIPEVGATAQAVATYERELNAMRAMFRRELDRIEQAQIVATKDQISASKQAEITAERTALAQLLAAFNSGQSFGQPLTALSDAGHAIPELLSNLAGDGVVTLSDLQSSFPVAARAVLDEASRTNAAAGDTNKITAFLRRQLGARSLQPRDGDSPDAVLSRAEAKLGGGDLAGALMELDGLTDLLQEQMAGWVLLAKTRQSADDAVASLAAAIGN